MLQNTDQLGQWTRNNKKNIVYINKTLMHYTIP